MTDYLKTLAFYRDIGIIFNTAYGLVSPCPSKLDKLVEYNSVSIMAGLNRVTHYYDEEGKYLSSATGHIHER